MSQAEERDRSIGGTRRTSERLGLKRESDCSVAGLNSDSPRTARHCWAPDCFMHFPGETLSRLSLQVLGRKEKANWVIKMSQG